MPSYDQTTSEWQTIPGYYVTCEYFSRNIPFVPVRLRLAVSFGTIDVERFLTRMSRRPFREARSKNRASSRHGECCRQAGYVSRYGRPGTRAGARLPPRRVAGAYHGIHGVYRAAPGRVPYDERREPGYASPEHGLGQRESGPVRPGNAPGDD